LDRIFAILNKNIVVLQKILTW